MSRNSSATISFGIILYNPDEDLDILKDFAKEKDMSSEEFISEFLIEEYSCLTYEYAGTYDYPTISFGYTFDSVDWGSQILNNLDISIEAQNQLYYFCIKYNLEEPTYLISSMYG